MRKTRLLFAVVVLISLLLLLTVSACANKNEVEPVDSSGLPPTVESPKAPDTAPVSDPVIPDEAEVKEYAFLWEIASGTTKIYLLGSIHIASLDIYPLAQSIEDAYAEAEYLVLELDSTQTSEAETTQLIVQHALYPPDTNLKAEISAELYTWLSEEFGQSGIEISQLAPFRPWFISLSLTQLQTQDLGYEAQYGIDMYFQNKAVVSGKEILELESAEYQFEVLGSIADDLWIFDLENTMQYPMVEGDMERFYDAWLQGDVNFMEKLALEPLIEYPQLKPLYDVMFDVRNAQMAEKIAGYLADDKVYFVIVGAGHLVGETGLISVLEEQGYAVSQVERQ